MISSFLSAPDVLALLRTNKMLSRMGKSSQFWGNLHLQHYPGSKHDNENSRDAYILQSHLSLLPRPIQFIPLRETRPWPDAREGHLCVNIQSSIVLTGGYTDDEAIYVKKFDADIDTGWMRIVPMTIANPFPASEVPDGYQHPPATPCFSYGASLTVLDENRAIRFGGFQGGGYRGEIPQVVVLSLDVASQSASWKVQHCSLQCKDWSRYFSIARAYHTATLLQKRYLLVTGGMKTNESVFSPFVLDTETWTWLEVPSAQPGWQPSCRHGHSAIWDERRSRLLVFGGGSGSDLLRSGVDNTEVWECVIPDCDLVNNLNLLATWKKLQDDEHPVARLDGDDDSGDEQQRPEPKLSPSQALCVGRCHDSFRVSHDTIVFVFGSGRPSSNGILGYSLSQERFFPIDTDGPRTTPRFTFAACFIEKLGYIFVHGGFCAQDGSTLGDALLLDVASGLRRTQRLFESEFRSRERRVVSDAEALSMLQPRIGRFATTGMILQYLAAHWQDDDSEDDSDYNPDS